MRVEVRRTPGARKGAYFYTQPRARGRTPEIGRSAVPQQMDV